MADYSNNSSNWDSFVTLKRWMENRNAGKSFVDYFHDYNYKEIAIYGAGDLGRLLYDEIKTSDIEVKYFVDRNGEGLQELNGIPIVTISQIPEMKDVDAIVVTPIANYDAICHDLVKQMPEIRTISLKDAVYEF